MKPNPSVVKMPVRVRRTVARGGGSTRALMVQCPVRRVTTATDRCVECERCEGFAMGEESISHVLCRVADPPHAPRKIMPTAAEVTPIGALMSTEVVCVAPTLGRAEAIALMLARGISGAPVVDDEGRPLGMLTRSDLLREDEAPRTVADLMMPIAFTLDENDPLSRAAALMAVEGVHHLPVIGDFGRVIGVISTLDVTRWLARQSGYDV